MRIPVTEYVPATAAIESVQIVHDLLRRAQLMHFDVARSIRRGAWS